MELEVPVRPSPLEEHTRSDAVTSSGVAHAGVDRAATLPDSAKDRAASEQVALNWVGMRGIAMPLSIAASSPQSSAASINAWVDLVDCSARGIHMSRLYDLLQSRLANRTIERQMVCDALDAMLASQAHLSRSAQLDISADVLLLRPALVSALAGWQRYPVTCRARKTDAGYSFEIELAVGYSSTCPSSAALARHAQSQAFLQRFGDRALAATDVAAWLDSPLGATATAHAQRSEARVRVRFGADSVWPDVKALVDRCEAALGTPLQTAVKRIDEQAFAMRNAENLMFCEDAARRLHAAFASDSQLGDFDIRVAHFESLHAHDAVASVSRSSAYRTLAIG